MKIFAFFTLLLLSAPLLHPQVRRGALAWRQTFDLVEEQSQTELFDSLLAELFFSADFGFKARDLAFSTSGGPLLGEQALYMAQGEIMPTASTLDFAVTGEGFFRVERNINDYLFTRNGNFQLNAEGWVVTEHGHRLVPHLRIDRAEVATLSIASNNRTLQIRRDGGALDLYDFMLFVPSSSLTATSDLDEGDLALDSEEITISNQGAYFTFPVFQEVAAPFAIQNRALELSTVRGERILARLSELLFRIRADSPGDNHEFRFYMLNHLLTSQLQMGQTAQSIRRFGELLKAVAPLLFFDDSLIPSNNI